MFEAHTESQLDAICGGNKDEPLPASLPGRAVAGPSSPGSYANPLSEAASWTKPLPTPPVERNAS
jgi:hypothetical protein